MTDSDPDVIVTSIQFGGDAINIQYLERRKQSEFGGVMESATYEVVYVAEQVDELQQNAVDLVDDILRLISHPPKKKAGERWAMDIADRLPITEEPDDED